MQEYPALRYWSKRIQCSSARSFHHQNSLSKSVYPFSHNHSDLQREACFSFFPSSIYSCRCRLAIQVGSTSAFLEVGCSFQLAPKSVVVQILRPFTSLCPLFRLSRMFNIRAPSFNCTTLHPLLLICRVAGHPRLSVIFTIRNFEKGSPFSSRPCVGNTNVPSINVILVPGRCKQPPFRMLRLCGYIIRKTPAKTVIRTFRYHKLAGFF